MPALDRRSDSTIDEVVYQSAFDAAPIGLSLSDSEGRLLRTNPRLRDLVGRAEDQLVGLPWDAFTAAGDGPVRRAMVARAIQRGRAEYDQRLVRPCGQVVPANIVTSVAEGPGGWVLVDHVREYESDGRLRKLAHDFNNLLSIVSNYATFAAKRVVGDGVTRAYLDNILTASRRATTLTRQLTAPEPEPEEVRADEAGVVGRGRRVLVVDDEPAMRSIAAHLLRERGFAVQTADGGGEALRRLEAEGPPDAVVSDVVMPGIDGHELVRQVRARWPLLPVVLMSGYSERSPAPYRSGLSCTAFVEKPFDARRLLDALCRVLDGPPRES